MDRTSDEGAMIKSVGENDAAWLQKQLEEFPHTFQLQGMDSLKRPKLKSLKSGLQSALKVGRKTDLETARARNLLAYVLYQLDQQDAALNEVEKVLSMDGQHNNLVSLANKAIFLWKEVQWNQARKCVKRLHSIKEECSDRDFQYLQIKSKAELAFTCTKLGPAFSAKATAMFEKIVPDAKEPELWLWKFGLALTKRRALRRDPKTISPIAIGQEEIAAEHWDVLSSFLEIVENCTSVNLLANTYAEIAMLLNGIWKNASLKREFCYKAKMDRVQACDKAIELDGEDSAVLCKCSRIYRYCRDTEKSLECLKKAVQIRPKSTVYHHLGLTYKTMATGEKTKDKPKVKGFYRQLSNQYNTVSAAEHYQTEMVQRLRQMSVNDPQHHVSKSMPVDETYPQNVPQLSFDRNIRKMQRVVKSTPKGVTAFTRDDKYIKEALYNFEQAVKVSQGENTRAIYDLAILQKALGENQGALDNFRKMLKNDACLHEIERINVYEQQGLVLKELADAEKDEIRKKDLNENSKSSLLFALTLATKIVPRSTPIREIWHSFSSLLQAVRDTESNEQTKLKEEARLLHLIRDHRESLRLLEDLHTMNPMSAKDPEYLRLRIEGYVAEQLYEDACTFLDMLRCLEQSTEILSLFGDKTYPRKIRVLAAFQALNHGSLSVAKGHFRLAFDDTMADDPANAEIDKPSNMTTDVNRPSVMAESVITPDIKRPSDMTSASVTERTTNATSKCIPSSGIKSCDIFLLHEDESVNKSESLIFLLHEVFGLRATSRDNAIPFGASEQDLVDSVRNSHITIVLAETEDHKDEMLHFLIRLAALSASTITLLSGEQACVPPLLAGHRSIRCPDVLLQYRPPPADDEWSINVRDDRPPHSVDEGQAKVGDNRPLYSVDDAHGTTSHNRRPPTVDDAHGTVSDNRRPPTVDGARGTWRDDWPPPTVDGARGTLGDDWPPPTVDGASGTLGYERRPPTVDDAHDIVNDDRRPHTVDNAHGTLRDNRRPPTNDDAHGTLSDDRRPPTVDEAHGTVGGDEWRPPTVDGAHGTLSDDRHPPTVDGAHGTVSYDRRPLSVDGTHGTVSDDRRPRIADGAHGAMNDNRRPYPLDDADGTMRYDKPPHSDAKPTEKTDGVCATLNEDIREALRQLIYFICNIEPQG